jgi:protein-tyrosine phosphatase
MQKILFVCLGNICRSPLAEGIFRHLAEKKGIINQLEIDSAGTYGGHAGELPDARTRKNALQHGITLTHRARPFKAADLLHYDLILTMDNQNYRDVIAEAKGDSTIIKKVKMMRDYDSIGKGEQVPDPYYGGEQDFELVFQMLYRSCSHLIEEIQRKLDK